jgi:hypothetical protein
MGCPRDSPTLFAETVAESLDRGSLDRSSPGDREDPRRHSRWRTHPPEHRELQRSADCPRGRRYGNRRDQNDVAFAMASADKWVRASLFPTKIDDCSEGPKSAGTDQAAQAIRPRFDYAQGSTHRNDRLGVHPNRHSGPRMPNLALLGFSCARYTSRTCAVGMITRRSPS